MARPLAQNRLSYNLHDRLPPPRSIFPMRRRFAFAREKNPDGGKAARSRAANSGRGYPPALPQSRFSPVRDCAKSKGGRARRAHREAAGGAFRSNQLICAFILTTAWPVKSLATPAERVAPRTGSFTTVRCFGRKTEGREGLELTFNSMLAGRHGKYNK